MIDRCKIADIQEDLTRYKRNVLNQNVPETSM